MKCSFNGVSAHSIIDSGAGVSVMDLGTFESLKLNRTVIVSSNEILLDASANEMDILGKVPISISIKGSEKEFTHEFRILNYRSYRNVILGRDVMSRFDEVIFDFQNNEITMDGNRIINASLPGRAVARIDGEITIPPRTELITVVRSSKDSAFITRDFLPTKIPGCAKLYISKARVIPNVDGKFIVTVVNVGNEPTTISKRQVMGHLNEPGEIVAIISQTAEVKEVPSKKINSSNVVLDDNLNDAHKARVVNLLKKYNDIFTDDPKKPSRNNLLSHDIITETAKPTYIKPRRIPMGWEKEVNSQVEEMLKNNIIRPSKSPWNAPIILVKKKDQSMRFVCDFRNLNDITKKDTYPLPQIKDVIDKMHGAKYWTTLDAASAYWSVPLTESSKEKTAFSVPHGKFEFEVTPYGLCNAGRSYQRMIDMCLSDLPKDRILAYIDDIVIFSRTFDDHLTDLESVFIKLREANISIKLSKCVFATSQVEYLGFLLSEGGIRPQTKLTEAISNYESPKTKKEVKRFLGMAGFYREFIEHFAIIAAPLHNLTRDSVPFTWSGECDKAFKKLKQALISAPVLAFPRTDTEFIVTVDASNVAVGGELSQLQEDGKTHPVAFFSNSLKDAQRNWSPYAQEAFALVMATRHWDTYLRGTKFVIHSDHNPLVYLRNKKNPKGMIARWITELESFDYEVKYIPGKLNCKADALSRNEGAQHNDLNDEKFEENVYAIVSTNNFKEQLKFEQTNDIIINTARSCVENNVDVNEGQLKRVSNQLRIEDGILTKSGRPVVPPSMLKYITTEYHRLGHFGVDKLYELVQQRFYWPKMYKYLANYVSQCNVCNQCKVDSKSPRAPLIPICDPQSPLEFVSIDVAHLPTTKNGFKSILLIGDVFSKYIEAVPMVDQRAETIRDALWSKWITRFGCPLYILSDQGSNVDGGVIRALCDDFKIQKRRTSGYHSQGNGFAERNIRTIRELFRTLLLDFEIPQNQWDRLLPGIVFALNTTVSHTTKCVPFEVLYGRKPILPIDMIFGTNLESAYVSTPEEYVSDLKIQLRDILLKVNENANISRKKMREQYNRNIVFYDYRPNDYVWLKRKHFKPGESKKLSPRKSGPWIVQRKLANGVNFEITNTKSNVTKVVHHNRLSPINSPTNKIKSTASFPYMKKKTIALDNEREIISSDDRSSTESDIDSISGDEPENIDDGPIRRYPRRVRIQRQIDGAIPWDQIPPI